MFLTSAQGSGPCLWVGGCFDTLRGLSEGFLELFGACCHGFQLQSLAGREAGREGGGGHAPACLEQALGLILSSLGGLAYTLQLLGFAVT